MSSLVPLVSPRAPVGVAVVAALLIALTGCSDGPAAAATPAPPAVDAAPAKTEIVVPNIVVSSAPEDIAKGEALFASKGCVACHKLDGTKLVGPSLKGVMTRRGQEWISKMILKPEVMVKEDETARNLLREHMVPMPGQGVDPATELPYLLAFLKAQG